MDNDEKANLLPLCSSFARPNKTMAVKEHITQFNSHFDEEDIDFDFIIGILIVN